VREFLLAIGEDPDRPGLEETPARVARAAQELFAGMREDPAAHLKKQFLEPEAHGLVVVRDIAFASMCEHHILPFYGVAHVCYLPADGCITGLSKLARVVAGYAARLQVQERLGEQIASAIMRELNPQGVLVLLEAEHTCMSMRGIRARGATTRTCATAGCLASEPYYAQALALIGR
jgi:GTP cyclohydrolase I